MAASIAYADAKNFGFLPMTEGEDICVALRNSADPTVLSEARRIIGRPFSVVKKTEREFDDLLAAHYGKQTIDTSAVTSGLEDADGLGGLAESMPTAADLLDTQDDAPVIQLINQLIAEAARTGASDIHIEPYENDVIVRLRVDGVLREVLRLPAKITSMLVSRIKVMARLDIAERRIPQDGRITLMRGERALDVRVSTLPSRGGERVVMRVLDRDQAEIGLSDLGMPAILHAQMESVLSQPNGIILVTGPTGSGKTTTLYAALRLLNDGARNILTVEDPVEYAVDGVGQTQVNTKVGMTFSTGLRAILRQDPDVIMIGEIRDFETAEIAIQASLTGHMVLSSVHTNDAVGAIVRLRDLGVEPFLLGSSLRLVLAQRLVRRLCDECKQPFDGPREALDTLGVGAGEQVYQPAGCQACSHTGYKGRLGLYEAVEITPSMRKLILEGANEHTLAQDAFQHGTSLQQSAAQLVSKGLTSIEEALRVTRTEAAYD
ncbi:MAG: type II secretion system ATPase GspE [Pseudomonadota bacterium]